MEWYIEHYAEINAWAQIAALAVGCAALIVAGIVAVLRGKRGKE